MTVARPEHRDVDLGVGVVAAGRREVTRGAPRHGGSAVDVPAAIRRAEHRHVRGAVAIEVRRRELVVVDAEEPVDDLVDEILDRHHQVAVQRVDEDAQQVLEERAEARLEVVQELGQQTAEGQRVDAVLDALRHGRRRRGRRRLVVPTAVGRVRPGPRHLEGDGRRGRRHADERQQELGQPGTGGQVLGAEARPKPVASMLLVAGPTDRVHVTVLERDCRCRCPYDARHRGGICIDV